MLVETEAMTETLAPETETRPRRLPTCPRRDRDETFDRSRDRLETSVPQNLESRINKGHTVVACTSPYVIVDFVYQQTKISA